jgi:hypothetical protein
MFTCMLERWLRLSEQDSIKVEWNLRFFYCLFNRRQHHGAQLQFELVLLSF